MLLIRKAVCVLLFVFIAMSYAAAEEKEDPLDKPIDADFEGTPLKDVLDHLSSSVGVNYVVSQEVLDGCPPICAKVKDVPLRELIEGIAAACGLCVEITEHSLIVLYWPEEPVLEMETEEKKD